MEDAAIRDVMLEKLNGAQHMLTEKELGIIYFLFFSIWKSVRHSLQKKWGLPGQRCSHRSTGF